MDDDDRPRIKVGKDAEEEEDDDDDDDRCTLMTNTKKVVFI